MIHHTEKYHSHGQDMLLTSMILDSDRKDIYEDYCGVYGIHWILEDASNTKLCRRYCHN